MVGGDGEDLPAEDLKCKVFKFLSDKVVSIVSTGTSICKDGESFCGRESLILGNVTVE